MKKFVLNSSIDSTRRMQYAFLFQNSMFFQLCYKKRCSREFSHVCLHVFHRIFVIQFFIHSFSLSLSRIHSSKYYDKWSRIECSESKQMRVPLPSSDKNYFNNSTCHVQEGEKQRKRNKRKTMNRGEGIRFIKFGHTI